MWQSRITYSGHCSHLQVLATKVSEEVTQSLAPRGDQGSRPPVLDVMRFLQMDSFPLKLRIEFSKDIVSPFCFFCSSVYFPSSLELQLTKPPRTYSVQHEDWT